MERLLGVLPKVLENFSGHDGIDAAVALAAWPQSAGGLVAARTLAVEFFEKRLIVAVQDETWRTHLEDLSPTLVAKLNAALGQGAVRFIEFRVSPGAFAGRAINARGTNEIAAPPPSLIAAAAAIEDEALRERFLTAASLSLDDRS